YRGQPFCFLGECFIYPHRRLFCFYQAPMRSLLVLGFLVSVAVTVPLSLVVPAAIFLRPSTLRVCFLSCFSSIRNAAAQFQRFLESTKSFSFAIAISSFLSMVVSFSSSRRSISDSNHSCASRWSFSAPSAFCSTL